MVNWKQQNHEVFQSWQKGLEIKMKMAQWKH